jgi:hypothetical protein
MIERIKKKSKEPKPIEKSKASSFLYKVYSILEVIT